MTVFQAMVLGVLQGLAEFLPISSSAHLSLAPWVFGWQDPGLAFDVALHVGTLVAVLWYFRAEWARLVVAALSIVRDRAVRTVEQRRMVHLIIATIPGAIAGLLLEKHAESTFRVPVLTASALIILGIILWLVDRYAARDRPLDRMTWRHALLIGLAQMFALIPGVSRSGSTMTAGRALGFERKDAAAFSFLMLMPITAAAALLKLPELLHAQGMTTPLVVGILTSAISGWLAIAFLLRILTRHGFGAFALYRVALGAVILALVVARG